MGQDANEKIQLLKRISELEEEVREREKDLAHFRSELAGANEKLKSLISKLTAELKMAHAIQKTLVPTELPHIPGVELSSKFVPSLISGGDYLDIFEHQDRFRFGVVVASSSGHGMSALFLSVLLKLTGQLEARKGAEPQAVLTKITQEMVPHVEGEATADIFYGVMDRRSYELSFVRAGDVQVFWHGHKDNEVKILTSKSAPIGKNFKAKFKTENLSLDAKDRVLICTRGVTECQNAKGEAFGAERLVQILLEDPARGVHELRNRIFYQLQKFCEGKEPARDQTVLVLEVKERIIRLAKP